MVQLERKHSKLAGRNGLPFNNFRINHSGQIGTEGFVERERTIRKQRQRIG